MTEVNIISPLSTTAILSYKYKLEETFIEGDQTVYKIKVIPRKSGNARLEVICTSMLIFGISIALI